MGTVFLKILFIQPFLRSVSGRGFPSMVLQINVSRFNRKISVFSQLYNTDNIKIWERWRMEKWKLTATTGRRDDIITLTDGEWSNVMTVDL